MFARPPSTTALKLAYVRVAAVRKVRVRITYDMGISRT
jgi:hypothetical protein